MGPNPEFGITIPLGTGSKSVFIGLIDKKFKFSKKKTNIKKPLVYLF